MGFFDLFMNKEQQQVVGRTYEAVSGLANYGMNKAASSVSSFISSFNAPRSPVVSNQSLTSTKQPVLTQGGNGPIGNTIAKYPQGSSGGGTGGGTGGGGYGDGGTGDGGAYGDGSSGQESAEAREQRIRAKQQKKLLKSIAKMKDSNIPFKYKIDYEELLNKPGRSKMKDYWALKEEVFLYSFHDKKHHKYINSITIDYDKTDILGTCQVTMPYDKKLMDYWIPGKTTFAIIGGTYDREVLFIARVSEVNQRGETIEMVGQNVGWKFKAYMTSKFEKMLQGLSVKDAVKLIFKELGFTKGRYHIDLNGIPDIDEYKLGENGSVEKGGEQIQNVPELTDVVKNIQKYNLNKVQAKNLKTRTIEQSADDYEKDKKMRTLKSVVENEHEYTPSYNRNSFGVSAKIKQKDKEEPTILYEPVLERIQGSQELEDYMVKGYSGDGENTYEDILQNIANAIDAHFFIVDTTVCFMSFNALIANSLQITKYLQTPTVEFWQLEEDSYEFNLNQYGYYNTVKIKYKNGTVKKSYEELVKVYGEIPITYKEPNLDHDAALLKAQAYLSAHIRDFGMDLHATVLYTGKIVPSTFVRLKNPLTMSEGLYFVHGISVQWSADSQTLIGDLDLRFGPENPDGLEVPETGTQYSSSSSGSGTTASANVSGSISQAAQEITQGCVSEDDKAFAIYDWVDKYVKYNFYFGSRHSPTEMLRCKIGNCWDQAHLIYELCSAADVKCEIWNGTFRFLDGPCGHLWNRIYYQGRMQFADTGFGASGSIKRNPIGSLHGGKILSGRCVAKNY